MGDQYFFDILGIGAREDSYTDLIDYAIKYNSEFRTRLMKLLVSDDTDRKLKTCKRTPVSIASQTGGRERNKDIPDLVLVDEEKNRIVIIESKLFSWEGWAQLERYASKEFRTSLAIQHKLVDPKFINVFLTLDDIKPGSSEFTAIKFKDVADCVPKNLGTTKLDMLLMEFKDRVEEHHNWPGPSKDDVALEYLKNTKRLVGGQQTFHKFCTNLLDDVHDFQREFWVTANRGCAFIPLVLFYRKQHWSSGKIAPSHDDGTKNFNIHFELQWYTREPGYLNLYVHYETQPYKSRKDLNGETPNFRKGYQETRNDFFSQLKQHTSELRDWNLRNSFLQMAYYKFDENMTFGNLKDKTLGLVTDMSKVLDECICKTFDGN